MKRIQIGAPRGNSSYDTSVLEPGIVYQCRIGEKCDEINLMDTDHERKVKNESKVQAWIGVSMNIIDWKKNETFVVCGHRWKDLGFADILHKVEPMTGSCYMIPIGNKEKRKKCRLLPLSNYSKFSRSVDRRGIFDRAMGQAGISSHCPKKIGEYEHAEHQLILGAPGVLNWEGATIFYNISQKERCDNYSSHLLESDFNYDQVYLGYAVSSGHISSKKDLVYAVSAPRAFEGNGMVLLFNYSKGGKINANIKLPGTQMGEYFGASLATADINQDGYDDLIIGAPRYSTPHDPDRGRIYISLGGEIISNKMDYINGQKKNAQFGTTVAALGDINNDGFEDVAVGAPYMNDNQGAVYVYAGGDRLSELQVIHAEQISSSLRGFGISIHHTAETCNSNKTYMAIGAYLSGHVVVLRRYPAISLHVQLTSKVKTIVKSNNNFSFRVCYWYNASCGPSEISVTSEIVLDRGYYRINIGGKNMGKRILNEDIILKNNEQSCNDYNATIREDKENVNHDIEIEASLTLNNNEPEPSTLVIKTDGTKTGTDRFCENCSVVISKPSDTLRLPFSACGDVENCNSELHLECSLIDIVNGSFEIGSSSEPKLQFVITNKKEVAYQTILHVEIPEPVKPLRPHRNCDKTTSPTATILHCNLKSPLDYNDKEPLTVELDMSHIAEKDLLSVTFHAHLTTASLNIGNFHQCSLDLKLKAIANMYIIGKTKDVMPYSSGTDIEFEQTYHVNKVGVSPVRKAEINIDIPHLLQISDDEKMEFLRIIYFQATQGRVVIECQSDPPLPTSSLEAEMPEITEEVSIEAEHLRSKREMTTPPEVHKYVSSSSSDNILYLNCTHMGVLCQKITCTRSFTDSKAPLDIKFTGKLNTSALGNIMKKKNIIQLSTNGRVDVKEPKNLIRTDIERRDIAVATISFVLEIPEKQVEVWVIALSAVGGIVVLVLIIIALKKVGFFRREKKEALTQLLAAPIAEDFFYQKKTDVIPAQQLSEANDSTEEISESECNQ